MILNGKQSFRYPQVHTTLKRPIPGFQILNRFRYPQVHTTLKRRKKRLQTTQSFRYPQVHTTLKHSAEFFPYQSVLDIHKFTLLSN